MHVRKRYTEENSTKTYEKSWWLNVLLAKDKPLSCAETTGENKPLHGAWNGPWSCYPLTYNSTLMFKGQKAKKFSSLEHWRFAWLIVTYEYEVPLQFGQIYSTVEFVEDFVFFQKERLRAKSPIPCIDFTLYYCPHVRA